MSDLAHEPQALGTRLIVGLGNPGPRYAGTRHNLGFEVVAELAERRRVQLGVLECNSLIAEARGLVLAAPQTYMNRSGYACRCLVQRRELDLGRLLIVYDDVALAFGRMRLRRAGGPGGHRGMESIVQSLQSEEIARLRLGVGPEEGDAAAVELVDYVLSPFTADESAEVPELVERAADACETWLAEGIEAAMNRFNS